MTNKYGKRTIRHLCVACGTDISYKNPNANYCRKCCVKRQIAQNKAYQKTDKNKAYQKAYKKAYWKTDKCKAYKKAYYLRKKKKKA